MRPSTGHQARGVGEKLLTQFNTVIDALHSGTPNYQALETNLKSFLDKEQHRTRKLEEIIFIEVMDSDKTYAISIMMCNTFELSEIELQVMTDEDTSIHSIHQIDIDLKDAETGY